MRWSGTNDDQDVAGGSNHNVVDGHHDRSGVYVGVSAVTSWVYSGEQTSVAGPGEVLDADVEVETYRHGERQIGMYAQTNEPGQWINGDPVEVRQ